MYRVWFKKGKPCIHELYELLDLLGYYGEDVTRIEKIHIPIG